MMARNAILQIHAYSAWPKTIHKYRPSLVILLICSIFVYVRAVAVRA